MPSKRTLLATSALGAALIATSYGVVHAGAYNASSGQVAWDYTGYGGPSAILRRVRQSPDQQQYVTCSVSSQSEQSVAICLMADAQGRAWSCYSSRPEHVRTVLALQPDDSISFQNWPAGSGRSTSECHTIRLIKSSMQLDGPVTSTVSSSTIGTFSTVGMK